MITITILDEINAHVDGLPEKKFNQLHSSMKLPKAGSFMTVAYQLKIDDGMESLISEDGFTYQLFLDDIVSMIEEMGYPESKIKIIDERLPIENFNTTLIDEKFLFDELGFDLRSEQVGCINSVITYRCGIIDAATSAGKTFICAAISKYFNDIISFIIIVPNTKLAEQTAESYKEVGLDVVICDPSIKSPKKRLELFKKHKNIIITTKLLNNILKDDESSDESVITGKRFGIIYDEVHVFGDTMFEAFRFNLHQCPIRIGMSGTIPKDKLKYAKISGCLNGDVLQTVSVSQLMDKGLISDTDIQMVITNDSVIQEISNADGVKQCVWDWPKEERYYANQERAEVIAKYIETLEPKNTLVLCRPDIGALIAKHFDLSVIDKDTPKEERNKQFHAFRTNDAHLCFASYDTSATGISENRVHRVIEIDAGKNEVWIKQGIGRGLRLDGEDNYCEVIDISSDTYYAKKHRNERKKIYANEKFNVYKNLINLKVR